MPATAAGFLRQKVPTPSEMTTVDWDRVRAQTRERAYFMAAVTRAEILDIFQRAGAEIADGRMSEAEARQWIREGLQAAGYVPRPGEEGSIKDLRTLRRMNVNLRTNVSMARNWATYQKQLRAVRAFPAKQMVRLQARMVPRNWRMRWRIAAGQLPGMGGINAEAMAAHLHSPIWVKLNRFGNPYPPYDFNSGMGDKILSREEAKQLGVLPPEQPETPPKEPPPPALNETLEAQPEVKTEAVWQQLEEDLDGLAVREGDRIVFTDPNGTKPYPAEKIPEVIGKPNRAGLPLHQADAVRDWAAYGPAPFTPGSDGLYHLRRLALRILPMTPGRPIWLQRIYASADERAGALARLQPGATWRPNTGDFPFAAFTRAEPAPPPGGFALRVVVREHATARDLTPAVEELAGQTAAHDAHVLLQRPEFIVLSVQASDDRVVTVEVAEQVLNAP